MSIRLNLAGKWIAALLAAFAISLIGVEWAKTQEVGTIWSTPIRLSSEEGIASEGYPVADRYGFVHVFWREILSDSRSIIQYARFDGRGWSGPIDIYVSSPSSQINQLSPVIDQQDDLHLFWTEVGTFSESRVYYVRASLFEAMSVHNWSNPLRLETNATLVKAQVDSKGIFHTLYSTYFTDPGVYYTRSQDQGSTWSDPVRLDPDILSGYAPGKLNFLLDKSGGLHATWFYISLIDGGAGDWVRYAHSLDGGETWSVPFTIDREDGSGRLRAAAAPIMAVAGQTVHVVWAAGSLNYRHHRYSIDAGKNWVEPVRIFGDLNGQAFDSLAVDASNRVHFLGQIRFPQGIYHAVWDRNRWTTPILIYFMRNSSEDTFDDHILAHDVHGVFRAGDQLVVFFADPPPDPQRRLFVINTPFVHVPGLQSVPVASQVPNPTPTALSQDQTRISSNEDLPRQHPKIDDIAQNSNLNQGNLWSGTYPTLMFLIVAIIFIRVIKKS